MSLTAKAVISALLRIDHEGWRLLSMKRTETFKRGSCSLKRHELPDDLGNICSFSYLLDDVICDQNKA